MNYDVLIAGGGPAGLSAALTAAQEGARVAVFEKSKEIGYPIHTSGGSWIDEMQRLGIPSKHYHPIHEGHFISPGQHAVFRYEQPVSCVLDIRSLYQYLAEIASKAGAEIFINAQVTEPIVEGSQLKGLHVRQFGRLQSFLAPLVIDASGVHSVVARKLGLSAGYKRIGVGAEYDLYAPNWTEERVALLFGTQIAPSGYGWIFPRGQGRLRIGIGLLRPDTKGDPKEYLEKLLAHPSFEKELSKISRLEYHAGIIPGEKYSGQTVADNFMAVGDAGGLISILLGEGIRFAIEIGRMAGAVAAKAVSHGHFDQNALLEFDQIWKDKYQRTFDIGALINERLARYTDRDWDEKIALLARMDASTVASLLKGDFTSKRLLEIMRKDWKMVGKSVFSTLKTGLKNA